LRGEAYLKDTESGKKWGKEINGLWGTENQAGPASKANALQQNGQLQHGQYQRWGVSLGNSAYMRKKTVFGGKISERGEAHAKKALGQKRR